MFEYEGYISNYTSNQWALADLHRLVREYVGTPVHATTDRCVRQLPEIKLRDEAGVIEICGSSSLFSSPSPYISGVSGDVRHFRSTILRNSVSSGYQSNRNPPRPNCVQKIYWDLYQVIPT